MESREPSSSNFNTIVLKIKVKNGFLDNGGRAFLFTPLEYLTLDTDHL